MGGVFAKGNTIGAFSWRNQVFYGNLFPFSSTQTISMNRYKPAWWLRNPHAQTIWASLVRKAPQVPTHREQLELPDGDFLDLRWTKTDPSPTVVVLHGLEGCFESNYIQGILFAIHQKGWRGVLVHFRNCGPLANRLARSYHAGDTADLEFVVHAIQERNPKVPLAVLGYSLGGNALLKWLGEKGPSVPVQGAVAVSVPFVLEQAMRRLETGFSRVYQWYFLRLLKRSALRKAALLPAPYSPSFIKGVAAIREFDHRLTAPLHGFAGADEYYEKSSARQYLKTIAAPTLILHAKDDPFMTREVIPPLEELSPQVRLELCEHGGHVGFIGGAWPWRSYGWLERRIPEFFSEIFQ